MDSRVVACEGFPAWPASYTEVSPPSRLRAPIYTSCCGDSAFRAEFAHKALAPYLILLRPRIGQAVDAWNGQHIQAPHSDWFVKLRNSETMNPQDSEIWPPIMSAEGRESQRKRPGPDSRAANACSYVSASFDFWQWFPWVAPSCCATSALFHF